MLKKLISLSLSLIFILGLSAMPVNALTTSEPLVCTCRCACSAKTSDASCAACAKDISLCAATNAPPKRQQRGLVGPQAVNEIKTVGDIEYTVQAMPQTGKNGTVALTKGSGFTGAVLAIPATIQIDNQDYDVISIGEKAFYSCTALTCVTIPKTVTSIGSSAFGECEKLGILHFKRSAVPALAGDSVFSGIAQSGTLYFPSGSADYTSTIFDDAGLPAGWSLLAFEPVKITAHPVNQMIKAGENAEFRVAANSNAQSIGYQWQESTDGQTWTDIQEATSETLTRTAVQISQNDNRYRCGVSVPGETRYSDAATLTVAGIKSISVSPDTANVSINSGRQFDAEVVVTGGANKDVTWSVSGTDSAIDASGLLAVGAAETADTLTVTATSEFDPNQSGTATVTISRVESVTITPDSASVKPGASEQFTADVKAFGGASEEVEWTVNSANSAIDAQGKLTVSAAETADVLTITATSKFEPGISGTASVTVPRIAGITVTPNAANITPGGNQSFAASVQAFGGADGAVTWGVDSTGSTIDAQGLLTVGANESAATLTVTATSVFDTSKSGTATVTINRITGIAILPNTASVQQETAQAFTASVMVTGNPSTAVTWSVDSTLSTIDANGVLTVAVNEMKQPLTVTATSVFDTTKAASVTVTITPKPADSAAAPTPPAAGDTGKSGTAATPKRVNAITISPNKATVNPGNTQKFTVSVGVSGGASTAVTWSVDSTLSSIDANGVLTVAENETASALTVTATSNFNTGKSASASVTVVYASSSAASKAPESASQPEPEEAVAGTEKDTGNVTLWFILIAIAAAAAIILIVLIKKKTARK